VEIKGLCCILITGSVFFSTGR